MPGGAPPLPGGGQGNGGAELLSKVKLLSFTADPDHILPFGSSTLRWQVETPGGVAFSLDGFATTVPAVGKQVVDPTVTTGFMLQARAREAEVTLGTVQVSVDVAQCVMQEKKDVALAVGGFLLFGFTVAAQQANYSLLVHFPVTVSITPGVITFDLKGNFPGLAVNLEVKGSFGLTVDRTQDQLAPINQVSEVDCSADTGTWVTVVVGGAVLVGALLGGVGGVIGAVIGAILGAATTGSALAWIVNTVSSVITGAMPAAFQQVVQAGIQTMFNEPVGMAMAAVRIDPDPASPPDGNITVTYCPRLSGVRGPVEGGAALV